MIVTPFSFPSFVSTTLFLLFRCDRLVPPLPLVARRSVMLGYPRLSFLILVSLLLITACSDDSPSGTGGTPDTTPPAVESVTPVDALHFDVRFSEPIRDVNPYYFSNDFLLVEAPGASAAGSTAAALPGDTLRIAVATLKPDKRTVAIATASSMNGLTYSLSVTGISDLHGNQVVTPLQTLFTASNAPDTTPPQILQMTPRPGDVDVPVNAGVLITFSEPVKYTSNSISWTSRNEPIYLRQYDADLYLSRISLFPDSPLPHNEVQRIALSGLTDISGNPVADTNWSFRTTSDKIAPTMVSTSPYNLATNVNVNQNITISFSEPLRFISWSISPYPGEFTVDSSSEGKTFTIDPPDPLLENQQYTITFSPGSINDTAGNGNTTLQQTVFTTGAKLAGGSIAGTIMGDPGSASADPTSALVIAQGKANTAVTTVIADNTYLLAHLPDGTMRQVFAIFDTNRDNQYYTFDGDAWGGYGLDMTMGDYSPDSVVVDNGSHVKGINFAIVDPSVIAGSIDYHGAFAGTNHNVWTGLFHASTFDPGNPNPVWAAVNGADDYSWRFVVGTNELTDGDYYVGGFIDINDDDSYTPGVEPTGMYGGLNSPTRLHIENGNDFLHIVIPMEDPASVSQRSSAAKSVRWPIHRPDRNLQSLMDTLDAAAAKINQPSRQTFAPPDVK